MDGMGLVLGRLQDAGFTDVAGVDAAEGGLAAVAAAVRLGDGSSVFAKTFAESPGTGVFEAEAEGLSALAAAGARTPRVLHVDRELLVLEQVRPRVDTPAAWEELGRTLAALHTSTRTDRFGWHRDVWLGRRRQDNTWHDDGHEFFARCRLLRWLPEPRVREALGPQGCAALERFCDRLPELLPAAPACLTHGDMWSQNVLSDGTGGPVLIDPAVSFTWAEVDLSMLWCSPRPPASDRLFDVYAEVAGLEDGWRERMPLLHLRQHLAVTAQYDPDWGHGADARALLKKFAPW
ncbi:fructosamine kinase family protein [Cellulomonas bogoriensis]|uniref:Aminoglycoside phosphotransferase n=1 Tax=Cellulomonas bogoriensis 69B4 = DSM 16987 TaxID=1386082 RepID=A0A0A0BZ13_9CELL|nr:fructosamine kinase family protein [Cellulomonas bogoriensis]KGM12409.1 aminoglycoside phosphotransferase [Cellulomonas bogoriensis 69B4 = DSM 16987]